jgi:membrane-associated protease RseP (regulator of RpoE activity)
VTQLVQRLDTGTAKPKPPPTGEEQRAALQRLVSILAAGAILSVLTGTWKTVLVIVAVMAMIMLHEFGHFVMAKRAGMKVTEFFIGFGPRLWSTRRGETEYGVKAFILLGGYVRIIGMTNLEEVPPEDEGRTYRAAKFRNKLGTIVAGSAMHFLLAFLLLFILHSVVGIFHRTPGAEIGGISRFDASVPSPAEQAGIRPGDRVLRANGIETPDSETLVAYIQEHPGQPVTLDVLRDGRARQLNVTPVDASTVRINGKAPTDEHVGFVGVEVGDAYQAERSNPIAALGRAGGDVGRVTSLSARGLADLVSFNGIRSYGDQLSGKEPEGEPGEEPRLLSPVGLVRIADQAAESGLREVLFLLTAINIFVGMLNMLPLLPFDGGHVAVATYERIRSRPGRRYQVDITKLLPLTYMVVLVLMFVTATSLYLDITQPLRF